MSQKGQESCWIIVGLIWFIEFNMNGPGMNNQKIPNFCCNDKVYEYQKKQITQGKVNVM